MVAKGLGGAAWPRQGRGLSVAGRASAGGCRARCAASYGRPSSWCSRTSWPPDRTRTARCSCPSGSAGGRGGGRGGGGGGGAGGAVGSEGRLDGGWRRARGVLIDTDVAHAFDCDGQLTAIGWIEGESRLAAQLRDRV